MGQIVTILIVHFAMGVGLPIQQMGTVVLCLIGLNFVSLLRYHHQESTTNTELLLELLLDVAALTVQIYLSGGASNPFISLFLLQVTLGAILLESWSVWFLVVITSACYVLLTLFYRELEVPHLHGSNFLNLHIQGMFVCFVLAACLLVLFIGRITRNLRARDTRLAELRQHSIEEDHIVRMGLLASGAAHELGTPLATLSVILGDWSRMREIRGNEELAQELEEMQAQLDRCKTIVSGILMSSGEARGEGTVHTSIRDFFDDVAAEWSSARSPSSFQYENVFRADHPMISDLALKQVLFNVLDNAYEASPDHVSMRIEPLDDAVAVTVVDEGPGFSDDVLGRLGKPYATTKNRPGAGLGLFLVVNVVRKLGGQVTATNRPEGGAQVAIELPLSMLRGSDT
ncbi:MAG TPA: ATP-binding protein [Xanthobacteraceae bacterium]|nr:ATP-binding protein [Xanthobacteraceae bacterium]